MLAIDCGEYQIKDLFSFSVIWLCRCACVAILKWGHCWVKKNPWSHTTAWFHDFTGLSQTHLGEIYNNDIVCTLLICVATLHNTFYEINIWIDYHMKKVCELLGMMTQWNYFFITNNYYNKSLVSQQMYNSIKMKIVKVYQQKRKSLTL